MKTFDVFDQYIAQGGRDYRPYFSSQQETQLVDDEHMLVFRRTAQPEIPQLALAFRERQPADYAALVAMVFTVEAPAWYYADRHAGPREKVIKLPSSSDHMPGCTIPAIDRIQAMYKQNSYPTKVSWLSATNDESWARNRIFPGMPLITAAVPLTHVMPTRKLVETTWNDIGEPEQIRDMDPNEVGIFGGIRPEWIINVEPGREREETQEMVSA